MPVILTILFIALACYSLHVKNKRHSKQCPRCGHYPCKPRSTGLVWKGARGSSVYDYKCPKCGYRFDNNPFFN